MLIIFGVGCSKQTPVSDDAVVFVQKEFAVTSENEAKNRVMTFLEAVKQQKNSSILREPYPDMEVNEGAWTLEAAANYEKNVNQGEGGKTRIETFIIAIDNISEDGVLKMIGTDMTAKYAALLDEVNLEENDGWLAIISDFKLIEANSIQTEIFINVVFEKNMEVQTEEGLIQWVEADDIIEKNINIANTPNGCAYWTPETTVYKAIDPWSSLFGTPRIGYGSAFLYDYDSTWISIDQEAVENTANTYIFQLNNQSNTYPLWSLRRVGMSVWYFDNDATKRMLIYQIVAVKIGYCY